MLTMAAMSLAPAAFWVYVDRLERKSKENQGAADMRQMELPPLTPEMARSLAHLIRDRLGFSFLIGVYCWRGLHLLYS